MLKTRVKGLLGLVLAVGFLLLWVGGVGVAGGIIYVAIHFISKFW